jgi:hypothetical protein
MVRIVVIAAFGTLLAGCSGSNRVENILPAWANTSPRAGAQPASRQNRSDGRSSPELEQRNRQDPGPPQEAKKPVVESGSEE